MSSAERVEIDSLHKIFGDGANSVRAIERISAAVGPGQICSVIGPSGCGKTTLLRILAGLTMPTEGRVVTRPSNVAMIFQQPVMFPWRTVRANIRLPLELHGRVGEEEEQRISDLLDGLGLRGFGDRRPSELSGGMLQRVSLARALISDPGLLLLDEPLSALDEMTRESLWCELRTILKRDDLTVLLVTHSIREAVFLGDMVMVLSRRPALVRSLHDVDFGLRSLSLLDDGNFSSLCRKLRSELE